MLREEKMTKKEQTFEKSLAELEGIIAELEGGELPLDNMMEHYEKGVKALKMCRKVLDAAEKKIEILVKDKDDALKTEPFEPDAEV